MTKQKFYDVSKKSFYYWESLGKDVASIMKFWLFRFAGIVDQSDRKLECPYALQAKRYSDQDGEMDKLIALLKKMRKTIDEFILLLESRGTL